jgi:hypothetical protein
MNEELPGSDGDRVTAQIARKGNVTLGEVLNESVINAALCGQGPRRDLPETVRLRQKHERISL